MKPYSDLRIKLILTVGLNLGEMTIPNESLEPRKKLLCPMNGIIQALGCQNPCEYYQEYVKNKE